MSTRAIHFLKQKGVSFDVVEYDHKQKGAKFASEAIGFPLAKTILKADAVAINGGQRGVMLVLKPDDIIRALNAVIDELTE